MLGLTTCPNTGFVLHALFEHETTQLQIFSHTFYIREVHISWSFWAMANEVGCFTGTARAWSTPPVSSCISWTLCFFLIRILGRQLGITVKWSLCTSSVVPLLSIPVLCNIITSKQSCSCQCLCLCLWAMYSSSVSSIRKKEDAFVLLLRLDPGQPRTISIL